MYYVVLVARDYNIQVIPRAVTGGINAIFRTVLESCNGPRVSSSCDITIDYSWTDITPASSTGQVIIYSGSGEATATPSGYQLTELTITNVTGVCAEYNALGACDSNLVTTTTTSTTTTTTTVPTIACNGAASYTGGANYPTTAVINLGSTTGTVSLSFDASSIPDLFLLQWNSTNVINTGYRGASYFDFGGSRRSEFNASLLGKTDPIYSTTYPDTTNYPNDGYPRVTSPGYGVLSFNKNLASPTTCTLKVYGPMTSTAWTATVSCPV